MEYTYAYPRPAVTADVILFDENRTRILLIKRKNNPFAGNWALPGGFMEMNETLLDAAQRELMEETSISGVSLHFFCMADKPDRDPRGRTLSGVFWGVCPALAMPLAADDAAELAWFGLNSLPDLAFDHAELLASFFEKDVIHDWASR
jgi:8-oxo-dGTP diphosphatase